MFKAQSREHALQLLEHTYEVAHLITTLNFITCVSRNQFYLSVQPCSDSGVPLIGENFDVGAQAGSY